MPPEDDPKNDEPIDREEWEAAMAESVSGEPPEKKWWNGGPLPHRVDPKEMSEEYARALYKEPPREEPPKQKIPCTCDGDDCEICYPSSKESYAAELSKRPDLCSRPSAPAPSDDRVEFPSGGPCSACGDGDTEQKYHKHVAPSSPVDLQQEAKELVDIVASEFQNFDGYDRAVRRVAAHLREGR